MAGNGEEVPEPVEEKDEYGFTRSEMYKSSLAGTVDPYDRHVFLCYKSHELWPPRVEDSDSDPLPKIFATALKARKNDFPLKTRLTICEGGDDVNLTDGDVLVFPDNIKYRGFKDSDVESFVDEVLVQVDEWKGGKPDALTGAYVFVCCHSNRDQRCGVCGPILIEKFKEVIDSKDLKEAVQVTACSHVGGHKYAGNVIIFSADAKKKIVSNWYGYVTPDDVPELIEKQILQGEVVERLWRGKMGAPVAEDGKFDELNPPTEPNGSTEQKFGGCCQGASGSTSCCRSENLKSIKTKLAGFGFGKWEHRHVLTSLAVVGALAAVLVVAHKTFHKARNATPFSPSYRCD